MKWNDCTKAIKGGIMDITEVKKKEKENLKAQKIEEFSREPVDVAQIEKELFGDVNSTPLGQLLAMIGSLPDIRQEKVFSVRDKIDTEEYDVDKNLETAIDKVLEELLQDG